MTGAKMAEKKAAERLQELQERMNTIFEVGTIPTGKGVSVLLSEVAELCTIAIDQEQRLQRVEREVGLG